MNLYNLTHSGDQYISELSPSVLPNSEYSLVEINYDDNIIGEVKTSYFNNNYLSEITLQNLDINNILIGEGETYIDKLNIFISTLSYEDKKSICETVNFIILPNHEEDSIDIKIQKIFILGLSSTLSLNRR